MPTMPEITEKLGRLVSRDVQGYVRSRLAAIRARRPSYGLQSGQIRSRSIKCWCRLTRAARTFPSACGMRSRSSHRSRIAPFRRSLPIC